MPNLDGGHTLAIGNRLLDGRHEFKIELTIGQITNHIPPSILSSVRSLRPRR